jgi:hypothetical protein
MSLAWAELHPPWGAEHRALLERHAPLLCFDPQDAYRATAAESMTQWPANRLARADDAVIADGDDLTLAALGDYPCGLRPAEDDRLIAGSDPVAAALVLQDRHRPTAYGRILRTEDGRTWLQYWLWYYDNPKHVFGWGRHQGDWELVQVELDADEAPVSVTGSQHTHAETRPWSAVADEEGRPVVYVAPFSHANYFEPRTRFYFPGADHPFGGGPRLVPAIAAFGEWVRWPGRWGGDHGRTLAGLAPNGRSPSGPGRQRGRWEDPAGFAEPAPAAPVAHRLASLAWQLGRAIAPHKPEVTAASLRGRRLTVRWTGAARHLLITAHRPVAPYATLRSAALRDVPETGTAELCLPEDLDACAVWVSTFNRLRQRSWPAGEAGAPDADEAAPYMVLQLPEPSTLTTSE